MLLKGRSRRELDLEEVIRIDHDTKGEPGTPNILETILRKIDECGVFIADVSFVASSAKGVGIPNPNVLMERGYALKAVGKSRLIAVINEAFGGAKGLPFDFKHARWPIRFKLPPGASTELRKKKRRELVTRLKEQILVVIEKELVTDIGESGETYKAVQPSSDVSSFLEVDDVLCEEAEPFGRATSKITWPGGAKLFIRVIPRSPIEARTPLELLDLMKDDHLGPFGDASYSWKINEFGAVAYAPSERGGRTHARSITQLFEGGEIWGINGSVLAQGKSIHWQFEPIFRKALTKYLSFARSDLGVKAPIRIVVGLAGIKGMGMIFPPPPPGRQYLHPVGGNCVKAEIVFDFSQNKFDVLSDQFDRFFRTVWECCGISRPKQLDEIIAAMNLEAAE